MPAAVASNVEESVELSFHGEAYLVHVQTQDDTLCIRVEEREDATVWKAQFAAKCGRSSCCSAPRETQGQAAL